MFIQLYDYFRCLFVVLLNCVLLYWKMFVLFCPPIYINEGTICWRNTSQYRPIQFYSIIFLSEGDKILEICLSLYTITSTFATDCLFWVLLGFFHLHCQQQPIGSHFPICHSSHHLSFQHTHFTLLNNVKYSIKAGGAASWTYVPWRAESLQVFMPYSHWTRASPQYALWEPWWRFPLIPNSQLMVSKLSNWF